MQGSGACGSAQQALLCWCITRWHCTAQITAPPSAPTSGRVAGVDGLRLTLALPALADAAPVTVALDLASTVGAQAVVTAGMVWAKLDTAGGKWAACEVGVCALPAGVAYVHRASVFTGSAHRAGSGT